MEGKKIYFLLVVFVIIVFSGCVISVIISDREAPEITFIEAGMVDQYSDDMETEELLKGVTAYDKQDGDVTDSLSVVNLIVLGNGESIQVTYAAKDTHNNITKKSAKIPYSGTKSFISVSSGSEDDSTPESTIPQETTENQQENAADPETVFTVGGSGEPVKIDQEAVNASGIPQIELKYTDYTIHVGDSFSTVEALDMVNTTYDEKEAVSNRIVINGIGNIDVNTAGDYILSYSVSDTDGNRSEVQKLTLHVIE